MAELSGEGDTIAVRRKRREKKKTGASSALERIKRGREMGVVDDSELEVTEDVFKYVDEKEYAMIVQQRQEEGFVLDDDGSYNEHGREIFDEEVDTPISSAKGMKKKKYAAPGRRAGKPTGGIKQMVLSMGDPSKRRKKEEAATVKDDKLLSDLLMEVEEKPSPSVVRVPHPHNATPSRSHTSFAPRLFSTPQGTRVNKKIRVVKSELRPSRPIKREPSPLLALDFDDNGVGDEVMEYEEKGVDGVGGVDGVDGVDGMGGVDGVGGVNDKGLTDMVAVNQEVEEHKQEGMAVDVPEEAVSATGWETVRGDIKQNNEQAFASVPLDSSSLPTREEGGETVLPFYWLDAFEDHYHQPGSVFLFGKVWAEEPQAFVSCCVVVKNISRCLYFLPREKLFSKSGQATGQDVRMEDLYAEFSEKFADRHQILKFTSKRVTKKYAFELRDIPSECEYLEVRYSCEYPAPAIDDTGRSYSRVFGTNTSCLERLILHCKLKGPSWLTIKSPNIPKLNISWCKCEAVVQSMDDVSIATKQAPPPPLVVMSLAVKITLNPKTGTNEILCLGSLVHPDIRFDKPPPDKPFQADLCSIRHPVDRDFPFRFEQFIQKKGFNVEVSPSERAMLAYFLAKLHRADPDIIVGHNLSAFALEVLQHRMSVCRVPQWSRVGRLKRKDMPRGRSVGHLLCAGRPVCDVKITAKELIRAKSYDLPELASHVLRTPHQPMEHENILRAFGSCEALGGVIAHTMDEAMLSLRLMYELNALPLAYQITCLAGNTLSRTLHGGRAERNELLLLHAFTAKNYICPDKAPYGKKAHTTHEDEEEEGGATPMKTGRRKPAYTGGLVLEPKRGFYDRYILLLDFNSLYPSIIQEYNICFTTIDHAHCSKEEDGYAKLRLPDVSEPTGVLPSEIRVLVERRRSVKQLMKEAKGNKELYMQYDIRQKALKLTANSMYGCLGFSHSRFHAQPLAAIITGKGREILANTKELAQKLNLDVIYGDTDSIMIDSNTRDLREAEKIAQRVKAEVNKLYKLLEIDVDGIYKAMLLLRKKKYAAVAVEWRDGVKCERTELKGLDIVRRDWCELAKKCGHYVISLILSGREMEKVIELIQSHLSQLAEQVNSGKTPLQEFVITKSLTKPPSDYPDKKGLPHVQVALRMQSRNLVVQAGDVVPYVMCKGEGNTSAALRAYHPDEVSKQEHLEVDTKYYLQHQVHAVVSRLCEPIEGLGPASIAEFLGLDPSGYRSIVKSEGVEEGVGIGVGEGGAKIDPFEDVALPVVDCRQCGKSIEVQGSKGGDPASGLSCPLCKTPFAPGRLINHLTLAIHKHIKRYYAGWLTCEDQTCKYRTRQPSIVLKSSAPQCPSCLHGKLREEYPASALYHQLVGLDLLFTLSGGGKNNKVDEKLSDTYQSIKSHVQSYLSKNQYSKIDLGRLFPKLTLR